MIQWFKDVTTDSILFKAFMVVMVLSFGVWGIGDVIAPSIDPNVAIQGGRFEVRASEVQRRFQVQIERLRENLGAEAAADPALKQLVLNNTVEELRQTAVTNMAALEMGKHVLTEARMALNAAEAHRMRDAARRHGKQVTQIVPSPFGLTGDTVIRELLASNYLGELREFHVYSLSGALADPEAPLSWRQDDVLSGVNMLTLGILHETISRWLPATTRVLAQACAFIPTRLDPGSGARREVGTPDSVQVLTQLAGGARGVYQLSGVAPFAPGSGVRFYGSRGMLFYDFTADRIFGSQRAGDLTEIAIPTEKSRGWRVEEDFVSSIRQGTPVRLTDFDSGVAYMEFTEAVARSAISGAAVGLPLEEYQDERHS